MTSPKKEIEILRRKIQHYDKLYFGEDDPEISDYEYDNLFQRLKYLETLNPDLVTFDSPTQRVGGQNTKKFPSVTHRTSMLSLDNTYNIQELKEDKQK